MKAIKIIGRPASEVMEIVKALREQGYVQGVDFDFSYHPPEWHTLESTPHTEKYSVFKFYNEKLSTFFALKYGHSGT